MAEPDEVKDKVGEHEFIEKRSRDHRIHEVVYILMKLRLAQLSVMGFVCYLLYDFHIFYKANFHQLVEWQMISVVAYIGGFLGAVKFMFEHITRPVKRENI